MKFVLHLQHLRHFQNQGYILFEGLVASKDCQSLEATIRAFVKSMTRDFRDIRWRENLFRTLPSVMELIKRQHLDRFAAELSHRAKLSLVRDFWFFAKEPITCNDCDCHLLLFLSGQKKGQGVFFSREYPVDLYVLQAEETALLLSFSS